MTLAARIQATDGKVRLEETTLPDPAGDEVLFEPAFAGVNPIDRYVAEGRVGAGGPLPRTLGCEASGWSEGRPVLVNHPSLGATRDGLWAQAAVVPRSAVVPLPEGVDLRCAAAMGVAGLTAHNVVRLAEVGKDDRVLVLGASGGVGLAVVSCAVAAGAVVSGQTGSPTKAAAILAQGAEHAFAADAETLAEAVGDWRPTVVIDPLGAQFTARAGALLPVGGRHVIFGTSAGAESTMNVQHLYRNGIRMFGYGGLQLTDDERRAGLAEALRELRDGRLRIVVGQTVSLHDCSTVFDVLADRTVVGKVLLDIGGPTG